MAYRRNANTSMGLVQSVEPNSYGAKITTDRAVAEIIFYHHDLVRVRIRKSDQAPEPVSYAVVQKPQEDLDVQVQENEERIILAASRVKVVIEKDPFRITFQDGQSRTLNEDDPFSTSWIGDQVTTYKKLQEGERFIGLGEKNGPLDRKGNAYTNWNTDAFAYGTDDDPLYLTTPFFMGLHHELSYGIFFDNTYRTTFSFGASSRRFSWFGADGGEMDYYFFTGEVADIIARYSWLTGYMPLPPKWSLGYQQCRYSYYPDTEVRSIARTFREKQIPCDVIYLDIHYMDGYRVFTFHPERFPEPQKLIDDLKEQGFRTAIIMDPGIKVDEEYATYRKCIDQNLYVRMPDGTPYEGEVWPGWSVFPDFTDEKARKWWAEETQFYTEMGIEALWNDMNEPTAWGHHLPNNLEFSWEGEGATHLQARNAYGMQMARATREAADQQLEKRPFILTRAGYSGVHRYATIWTGDNVASDEHMVSGARMLANMGLTGMPFTGYDVGAFVGECSPNLFARWLQLGAFAPFFRGHSMVNSRDSEPWSYGEQYEEISRNYIGLRYQMIPYILSCMFQAHRTGIPLVRSLAIDYTFDGMIYEADYQSQYQFGPSMLVIPVKSEEKLKKIYLPEGKWYDLFTDIPYLGGMEAIVETEIDKLPVFAKAGTAIALQQTIQHTGELPEDKTLHLHLYADDTGIFRFDLYDDQDQHQPQEDRQFWHRELTFEAGDKKLALGANQGEWESNFEQVKIWFHGCRGLSSVRVGTKTVDTIDEDFRLIQPISKFDPFGPESGRVLEAKNIPTICLTLENQDAPLNLNW